MVKSGDGGAKPGEMRVPRNCVQVWRLDLTSGRDRRWLGRAGQILQSHEAERAGRMRAEVAREEFVAGRAALRWLLGRELGCEPRDVALRAGQHGKPGLADEACGLAFNVAHSKGRVLIALSRAGEVGVDIEQENDAIEALELARSTFHADDLVCIEHAAETERAALFFRCWTRKEAVAKADGRGLSLPMSSFSVGISADVVEEFAVGVAKSAWDQHAENAGAAESGYLFDNGGYFVRDLAVAPGFAAALAVSSPGASVAIQDLGHCEDFGIGTELSRHHPVGAYYNG